MNRDCRHTWNAAADQVVKVPGNVFGSRVRKSLDVVKHLVIKARNDPAGFPRKIAEVHHPSEFGIDLAEDCHLNLEQVSVKPGAFVILPDFRKPMRRFKTEFLNDFCFQVKSPGFRSESGFAFPERKGDSPHKRLKVKEITVSM